MGYAVLHMEKTSGTDAAMSAHIERTIKPKNADESRTHLNRELITFPDGVEGRDASHTAPIGHCRIDTQNRQQPSKGNPCPTYGNARGHMEYIANEDRLDEWCSDNLKYLADTFGRENIVSAVLHMDEQTPHIHATLVPIVRGERKAQEERGTG